MATNLKSKLKSALRHDIDPAPAAPTRTYSPWEAPSADDVESNATQRREGARALANVERPPDPVFGTQQITGGGP